MLLVDIRPEEFHIRTNSFWRLDKCLSALCSPQSTHHEAKQKTLSVQPSLRIRLDLEPTFHRSKRTVTAISQSHKFMKAHQSLSCSIFNDSSQYASTVIEMAQDKKDYKPLTKEEERVIVFKGTERPFIGLFNDNWKKGTYICKRCGAKLYRSESKFEANCGWPSFDQEIPGAVKRSPDSDGVRTEISCANCGAHLGHVFTGEGFTEKNVRHCVNSISMDFIPAKPEDDKKSKKE